MTVVMGAVSLLTLFVWGDLVFGLLDDGRPRAAPVAYRVGLSWILASGVTTWLMFLALWIGFPLTPTVVGLSLAGLILWSAVRLRRLGEARRPAFVPPWSGAGATWRLVWTLIILVQTVQVGFTAAVSPLVAWDSWLNWAGKANVLFVQQSLSADVYGNLARLPTNMHYPLMLPLLEVWFYAWAGRIHEPYIGVISVCFFGALVLLFFHAARQLTSTTVALGFTAVLVTTPRLVSLASVGMADIPMAAVVLACFLVLYLWVDETSVMLERPIKGLLALIVLSAMLPWFKTEGWVWFGLVALVFLLALGAQVRRQSRDMRPALAAALLYLGPALALASLWSVFLALHGTHYYIYLPATVQNLWLNIDRFPQIAIRVVWHLVIPYWNFIWVASGLIILVKGKSVFRVPQGWLIVVPVLFVSVVSLTYLLSRFDPYLAHFNNSIDRLLWQALPLTLWWTLTQLNFFFPSSFRSTTRGSRYAS